MIHRIHFWLEVVAAILGFVGFTLSIARAGGIIPRDTTAIPVWALVIASATCLTTSHCLHIWCAARRTKED